MYRTLLLLSVAFTVYEGLTDATVKVESLNRPLETYIYRTWNLSHGAYKSGNIDRSMAMVLVAYFEGGHDIDPTSLEDVMAISAGDSVYVPKKVMYHSRSFIAL